MRFAAVLRIEFEADDIADAVETLEAILDGGVDMATATVTEKRVIHLRRGDQRRRQAAS